MVKILCYIIALPFILMILGAATLTIVSLIILLSFEFWFFFIIVVGFFLGMFILDYLEAKE